MKWRWIVAFVLLVSWTTSYDISISCGSSGCTQGCSRCQILRGGPFTNLSSCVDYKGGCSKNSSFSISFACKGCSNREDCSYTVSQGESSFSGCTNAADIFWPYWKGVLDLLYAVVKQTSDPYDWCQASCGLSTGAIVGIVVAVLAVLGLIVAGVFCYIKRKKRFSDSYHKHSSSLLA